MAGRGTGPQLDSIKARQNINPTKQKLAWQLDQQRARPLDEFVLSYLKNRI